MSKHYDKMMTALDTSAAQAKAQAALPAWERERRTMTRDEVRSYLAGFGLKGSALMMVTQTWEKDVNQAQIVSYEGGWGDGWREGRESQD